MIIKTDQNEIQNFLRDASNTSGFCDAVYFPESKEDVINIFKEANEKNIPVTIAGNRTGLTGAGIPNGGIVLSTDKLNRILEINEKEKYAIVQPGVLLSDFINEVKKFNLFYPPDPTELNCYIGGTVATNASGAKTFKYGATRNFVLGLEMILPTGEQLSLNRNEFFADGLNISLPKGIHSDKTNFGKLIKLKLPDIKMPDVKNASGYYCKKNMDAIDLFIGSEGTLGIFTEIKLKLLDLPENILSSVVFFYSGDDALQFLTEVKQNSFDANDKIIDALALEFFDEYSLILLKKDYPNIPEESKAAIWFEQIVNHNEEAISNAWIRLLEQNNCDVEKSWMAFSEKERKGIEEFRHSISAKVNELIASRGFRKLGTDVAVPDDVFIQFYKQIKKDVTDEGLKYVAYGHFGNSHVHLNMLPENDYEFEKAKTLYKKICSEAIKSGGTFSAEHGVGKNKTEYLIEMYGKEAVEKMKEIKRKLDPKMILGRGNVFKY